MATSRNIIQMDAEMRSRNLLWVVHVLSLSNQVVTNWKSMIGIPIEDFQVQDLIRDRQHHLGGVDAQLNTFPSTVFRDPTIGSVARPGEAYHEDSFVVLAEDR